MFSKELQEKKITKNRGIIITQAIDALNRLTQHYQKTNHSVAIKLSAPWENGLIFEPEKAIAGLIDLTAPPVTESLEEHPFITVLTAMKLQVFPHSYTDSSPYHYWFYLDDFSLIRQLPAKCEEYIEDDLQQKQAFQI